MEISNTPVGDYHFRAQDDHVLTDGITSDLIISPITVPCEAGLRLGEDYHVIQRGESFRHAATIVMTVGLL
jgi:hypothetical protein